MSNSEKALEILTEIYKEINPDFEPNYYAIKEHSIFFVGGYYKSFYDRYKRLGLCVNTTRNKGGLTINKHGKHMGVLEFDNVLEKVFFLKDENKIVLQVDGKYDYCNLTLKKEEFDELLETIPSLIESAGYYSVEVSETDENVVCLNLVKIIK